MSADKDRIRTRERRDVCFEKVANMDIDAWCTETTGILLDDGLALRTDLEGFDMQMRELQTSLDGDAARAETDIPEDMMLG